MKSLADKIDVMIAAQNGKTIEYCDGGCWEDIDTKDIIWNWPDCDYRIKPEPAKWYESIPEGGVLCWATTSLIGQIPVIVFNQELGNFNHDDEFIPLTKQEIQVFLGNAPEEEV